MPIEFINPFTKKKIWLSDIGMQDGENIIFPLKKGAYRIVKGDNYTQNFGYQWNRFTDTQIDKKTNLNISKKRFFVETGWNPEDLTGKNILEVGSGAGRFTQIVLDHTKANLYSVDYSNAVEANYKNNGPNERLHLFQASIYEMPFEKAQFDKVFCFGVLQHTPDVKLSIQCLVDMVKPGGELVVDFYPRKGWWTKIHAKYLLRPFTKKMSNEILFKTINKNIDWLIKTSTFFSKIGLNKLNRFLPIVDIKGTLPQNLTYRQLRELCVLDTFDMFSPEYDEPQKIETIKDYFTEFEMHNVWGGLIKYDNFSAAVVKGVRVDNGL